MKSQLTCVIIMGNPRYIDNDLARRYYEAIRQYLVTRGVQVVFDAGADYTCPPQADFYVAHSKGCGRRLCFEGRARPGLKNFLMFGDPRGVIHPVDLDWQTKHPPDPDKFQMPPPEHFEFTPAQQQAIDAKIADLKTAPRQSRVQRPR